MVIFFLLVSFKRLYGMCCWFMVVKSRCLDCECVLELWIRYVVRRYWGHVEQFLHELPSGLLVDFQWRQWFFIMFELLPRNMVICNWHHFKRCLFRV